MPFHSVCPDGPYRLPWQGLLSYKLPAIPSFWQILLLLLMFKLSMYKKTMS
jgi:hypothetical protein